MNRTMRYTAAILLGSAIGVCLVFTLGASDASNQPFAPFPRGYQQINDPSTATGLSLPSNSQSALIQVLDQNVRIRDDGTNPTTSVGFRIAAGDSLTYDGDLRKVRIIEESSGAEVNILYYGH